MFQVFGFNNSFGISVEIKIDRYCQLNWKIESVLWRMNITELGFVKR